MALVLSVMAASILVGSMLHVVGSMSTKTGLAPTIQIASAVAKKVLATVMTSSPGPMPSAMKDSQSASVPIAADGVLRAPIGRQFLLEPRQRRAHDVLAALQHLVNGGVDLVLHVVILPDVTVEPDFHCSTPLLDSAESGINAHYSDLIVDNRRRVIDIQSSARISQVETNLQEGFGM